MPEDSDKRWRADLSVGKSNLSLRFSDDGLLLGTGTVLARVNDAARDIEIDVTQPRLTSLLAAAHLRLPTPAGLAHLRKAAERWREGEDGLAAMHLALSRLDRLERPLADDQRLFLADGLLDAGLDAETLIRALDLDTVQNRRASKYSPSQPRVPAGSGRTVGSGRQAQDRRSTLRHMLLVRGLPRRGGVNRRAGISRCKGRLRANQPSRGGQVRFPSVHPL